MKRLFLAAVVAFASLVAPAQTIHRIPATDSSNAWTGLNSFNLSPTMPTPVNPTDGANKAYVDSHAGGSVSLPSAIVFGNGLSPARAAVSADVSGIFHSLSTVPRVILNTTFNEGAVGTTLAGTAPAVGPASKTWQFGDAATAWNFKAGGGVTAPSTTGSPFTGGAFIDLGVANYTINISFANIAAHSLVMLRYTDPNNVVFVNLGDTRMQIFNQVGGTQTALSGFATIDDTSIKIVISGQTVTVSDGAGNGPYVATIPAGTNTSATNAGFTTYSGAGGVVSSMSVVSGTTTGNITCSGALESDGVCRTVVPNVAAMISGSPSQNALSIAEVQTLDNGDGTGVLACQEDHKRGIYDPRCIQYAGGLLNASTATQQQLAIQAAIDQAGCDIHDGKIGGATVVYPAGVASGISNLMVHAGVTFKCSVVDTLFGGSCGLTDSAPMAGTITATTGVMMIRMDQTNHGMCHGADTVFGGGNASVIGFNFAGQDGAGGNEIGVYAFAVHNYVAHNTFNAFGGSAVIMSGAPGDGVAEWNFITNSPKYWIENPAEIPVTGNSVDQGFVAAMACTGEDTTCEHNEVSTGSVQVHGGAKQANYPHVVAMLVDGGGARINNNFVQVSDVGLLVLCCSAGNEINGLRSDIMAGSGIISAGGGSVFTNIAVNQPCEDPAWVNPTTHVSGCFAINDGNGNTWSGVVGFPFPGFGSIFVGAMFGASRNGTFSSYSNGFTTDAFGNGADFVNSEETAFGGLAAPAGAQQSTTSCTFNGQTVIATAGCSHIQFTDTTPISIIAFRGMGDGKTITVEGTVNDTLTPTAGLTDATGLATCFGGPVTLGNGPISFFYTTRDSMLHQVCDRNPDSQQIGHFGQTPPANTNRFTLDMFGSAIVRQATQTSMSVFSVGLSPGAFQYCYIAYATVYGEPSSSAPVCDNHTPPPGPGSGGSPFISLTLNFMKGWEAEEVDLFSTTDPAFTPGVLKTFTPSQFPGIAQTTGVVYTTTLITPTGTPKTPNLNGTGGLNDHRAIPAHSTEPCPDGDKADGVGPGGTGFGRYICHPANTWTFVPGGTPVTTF